MKRGLLVGVVLGAGAVALFSGASLGSVLFPLLILVCPLMMLFMDHGAGHGTESHDAHRSEDPVRGGR